MTNLLSRPSVRIDNREVSSIVCMLSLLTVALPSKDAFADITVDGAVRYQTMDGFGCSVHVFDDPHVFNNFNTASGRAATIMTKAQQNQVLRRLYSDLKLTRIRPVTGSGIEPVNDNSDPNVTDLSKFDFSWKKLDAHVDYIVRARQRGATVFYLSPLNREAWMGTTTASDVAEYSEWLLAQVKRAADRGVRFPFLSVANEPSYTRNAMSATFVRDVIKTLGPRLTAEGLATKFVIPDDIRSSNSAANAQIILADPMARQYVRALATHLYDEPISNISQMKVLSDQYQLPLWMTEFSVKNAFSWASLMHDLISTYNVSAVDYMWGFFGRWEGSETTLISLNNTGATYDGFTPNKTFYTMGQFSRFIEPGATRIKAQSTDADVLVTAYLSDSKLVLVAIHNGRATKDVTFGLSGVPNAPQFDPVRTSATESWVTLHPLNVGGASFTATLPANSITTFTARIYGSASGAQKNQKQERH